MSKPWPDELRQMVDALMHGGACPSVYGCSDGGWRIHTGRAWADYDVDGDWLFQGACVSGAVALAELLQRSDTTAPAQTLSNRILVAVPTARTVTTDDGIEVTVGSKSVRWKRERNGWSLGDDLFTSDERVIEHARAMAVDAAAEAQWKLATDLSSRLKAKGIETCTVRNLDTGVVTVSAESTLGCWHSAELRDGRWHYSGVEIATTAEAYRVLLEAAAPPKPAADRPPVEVEALVARLRTKYPDASIEAKHSHGEWHIDGERGTAGFGTRYEGGGWRYGGRPLLTGDEIVERVARLFDDHAPQPSPRALDTDAVLRAVGQRTEEFLDTLNEDPAAAAEAAKKLARTVTVNVNASSFMPDEFAEAVARAIEEQSKRQRSHEWQRSVLTRMLEDSKERGFKPPQPAGATTMTKALDQAKVDASEAALRTAAKQLAKAARDPLAGAVARHLAPGDESMRARVAAMLETEAGLAMLKAVLSLALSAIPQAGTRGAALAHELRVQAMADGADLALDVIAGPLREVVALYLQDAPGAPAAAPALDAPKHEATEFAATTQREGVR